TSRTPARTTPRCTRTSPTHRSTAIVRPWKSSSRPTRAPPITAWPTPSTTASCARSRPAGWNANCMVVRGLTARRRAALLPLLPLVALLLALGPAPQKTTTQFPLGVACGDMTADSAVLWTRTDRPTALVAEIDRRPDFAAARRLSADAAPASDLTVHTAATDLAAGTLYYYRFRAADGGLSATGSCRTAYAPDQPARVTFAFSGDTDWIWRPYPLLRALNREPLDFFLFLGDLIYEWTSDDVPFLDRPVAETLAEYRELYRRTRSPRPEAPARNELRETYERFGQYSLFDNHEIGLSRADPAAPPYTEGGAPPPSMVFVT